MPIKMPLHEDVLHILVHLYDVSHLLSNGRAMQLDMQLALAINNCYVQRLASVYSPQVLPASLGEPGQIEAVPLAAWGDLCLAVPQAEALILLSNASCIETQDALLQDEISSACVLQRRLAALRGNLHDASFTTTFCISRHVWHEQACIQHHGQRRVAGDRFLNAFAESLRLHHAAAKTISRMRDVCACPVCPESWRP